jgi:hypothetical protein
MRKPSLLSHQGLAVAVLLGIQGTAYAANNSHCESWSDADFARDANESGEFLSYITQPERLDADLDYNESSPDKPKVDQVFRFDSPDNIRCKKLAVKDGKISVRTAVENYARALAKFRGCDDRELKNLIESQRKSFSEKQKSSGKKLAGEKRPSLSTEKVHRLNWATELYEKSGGKIFAFVSGPSTGSENFGTAVFRLTLENGKQVDKRVPITSVSDAGFCGTIPAIERRLNALYEQEQSRLQAKKSDDGTAECLAWFSSSKEFNGKPAGTGLLSYLKIEPVSPSKFNFDPEYSRVSETEVGSAKLKKLTLTPYQSVDSISLTRDDQGHLVTAEIYTPGVRKSRYGEDLFFNKVIDFDYSSGRCRPQTIEYSESAGKFKITQQTCRQIQSGGSVENLTQLEREAKDFLTAYRKANRAPADKSAKKNSRSATGDAMGLVRGFCSNFDYYLEE